LREAWGLINPNVGMPPVAHSDIRVAIHPNRLLDGNRQRGQTPVQPVIFGLPRFGSYALAAGIPCSGTVKRIVSLAITR
jgi:hypothetical protein